MEFVGTISIACPRGVPYALSILSDNNCELQANGLAIPYRVYSDPTHASPLGMCGFGAGQAALTGTGTQTYTIYGEALVRDARLDTGLYTDSIRLLLDYGPNAR